MKSRKSYVDTRHGQVHLRSLGDAPRTLLMLHWTPLSGRMYEPVAQCFVQAGWTVRMPDLLGYGRSDPRPEPWSIEAWADSVAEVIDRLGLQSVVLLGGHNGASIATEVALRHSARVRALILDGCPILTDELRAAFKALTNVPRPLPSADGAHKSLAWERAERLLAEYIPGFTVTAQTIDLVWPAMIDYLHTDFVSSGPVAGAYDLAQRLGLLRQPTLLLSAQRDTLASTFAQAQALLPAAQAFQFAGDHPIHFADQAAVYAAPVLRFLEGL
jgi:pimeloyl-ACP methyl ester carboxylesterase